VAAFGALPQAIPRTHKEGFVLSPRYYRGDSGIGECMDTRTYRHFCMMARALELVGERWSLLIVRDLCLGPQRFTGLARSLAEITPATLTNRLRRLEAVGIVTRDQPDRGREVWYRLTEAGRELRPIVEALTLWGMEHAFEPPREGERVFPIPAMLGTKTWLSRHAVPPGSVTWVWRFPADHSYKLSFDRGAWTLSRAGDEVPSVIVETTPDAWARFLTTSSGSRELGSAVRLAGTAKAINLFARAFRGELSGP
jgi:DNA-binding HxlR family transcriptional regulator